MTKSNAEEPLRVVAISGSLRSNGYTCKALNIALEGARELGAQTQLIPLNDYDLIFVDIHMPNLDGFGVLSALRERHITKPMIAVTALRLDGVDQVALDAGYNDFLIKPIEQKDVLKVIKEYVPN